ncbi:hypothetical protein STIV2_B265 [Sulfolobus turreted icosahedral virus 2]|uniref:Uncharacterized protein n=1 Tax=Sulfolobus turreted icosahedral virus 2 TaxID=754004 RepID=D5IEZ7_9VIRU|nr:hypothetical protein STIV2_B265 [Sulfolobus turreted icosahedral virus 2]ADF27768.1 hypothetical protein STIV2_B265 [Sulfolobus turreted icosahedral virus 2]
MSELYDPQQDLTKICSNEFFAPEPEKIVVNGKEIVVKGRKRMDVIADLLNNGVDEECIVKGIESWWGNRHPREYLRAIKSKLKLKEAAQNEQKVDESLKLNVEEKKEEGEAEGTPEGELQGELPELTETGQKPIEINEEVVALAYGALLELVVRILSIKYKKDIDLNDIIPDERIRQHGKYYYQLLDAVGLLNERYIQLFILGIGSAGAAASDIVSIITYFKSQEDEEGDKSNEKKQWKGEGNKTDLNEKDKIKSQMRVMEEIPL